MVAHYYGDFPNIAGFIGQMNDTYRNVPIWVTEFADTSNNDTEVYNFMQETLRYLDELEWIEKYAWFGFFVCHASPSLYPSSDKISAP